MCVSESFTKLKLPSKVGDPRPVQHWRCDSFDLFGLLESFFLRVRAQDGTTRRQVDKAETKTYAHCSHCFYRHSSFEGLPHFHTHTHTHSHTHSAGARLSLLILRTETATFTVIIKISGSSGTSSKRVQYIDPHCLPLGPFYVTRNHQMPQHAECNTLPLSTFCLWGHLNTHVSDHFSQWLQITATRITFQFAVGWFSLSQGVRVK